jgi:hypothetical protein
MSDRTEPISLRLAARVWATIDAQVDNTISVAAVDGPEESVRMGQAIRYAGWVQVPWVDEDWPPMDQQIAITLTREQWEFALVEVEDSIPIYESIGDNLSAQLGRDVLAALRAGGI